MDWRNNYEKTINNILKKYLFRDVALHYTAQKQSGDKLLLKETNFCKCVLGKIYYVFIRKHNTFCKKIQIY